MAKVPDSQTFQIQLDNSSYFAGQEISGSVVANLSHEEGLQIRCIGRGNVEWNGFQKMREFFTPVDSNRSLNNIQPVPFSAEEIFLDLKSILVDRAEGVQKNGTTTTAKLGFKNIPFSLQVPGNLPSSFQGTHGSIEYVLVAKIIHPTGPYPQNTNQTCKQHFILNSVVDLNLAKYEFASKPIELYKDMKLGFKLRKSTGLIGFKLNLERSGFVRGEDIRFICNLFNNSSKDIKSVIRLVQHVNYHAKGKSENFTSTIIEKTGQVIGPKRSVQFECVGPDPGVLRIPQLVLPTMTGEGKLIEIEYSLEVEMTRKLESLVGSIPILIGTIPFEKYALEQDPSSKYAMMAISSETVLSDNKESPPPSYDDATQSDNRRI